MKNILRRILLLFSVVAAVILWHTPAEAAPSFTITQIPASGLELVLATAQTVTIRITNTSTNGETISNVRFRTLTGSYSTFPQASTPPMNWNQSVTTYPATTITFNANATAYRIPPTGVMDFVVTIRGAAATDIANDHFRDIRATFRTTTGGTSTTNISNPGSWTWKSLLMTLVPSPTAVGIGCQFTLTMGVTNKSTANGLVITSFPSPRPTANTGGGASVNTPSPVPASLTLNAGAAGSIVWTYTLSGLSGTVYFTACASTGASCTTVSGTSRTSSIVQSGTVTVDNTVSCGFSSALTVTPTCLYSGDIATIQMGVTNTTGAPVNNVAPSALISVVTGSAAFSPCTGPAPATIASLATGTTGTFTWTATVTGNPNDTYAVQGYATANGPITSPTTTSSKQDIDGYVVTVSPTSTNANSTNVELTWTIANYGCSNANQVSIAVPVGWTFANDAYALVNNTAGAQVDTWNPVGTTLTSPSATDRIPPAPATNTGDFSLLFSQTPSATGVYTFDVTIIDDALPPVTRIKQTTVTVNPFGSGSLNDTGTTIWHENAP